ncbi:hypothetical protein [Larkinella terrae]|uniref:Uncharacterized protein n=1 Tax=Larkinella terrae TaxID=2025311 RepID=A0A7K0EIU8_9BACT|nr:hypothetical protein [Larkinella terrae]MRS61769.1 hypothetical protein [Larkinella terrae]
MPDPIPPPQPIIVHKIAFDVEYVPGGSKATVYPNDTAAELTKTQLWLLIAGLTDIHEKMVY